MNQARSAFAAGLLLTSVLALACSSADDTVVPGADAGSTKDSATTPDSSVAPDASADASAKDSAAASDSSGVDSAAPDSSVIDSGPPPVNGCKDTDYVAANTIKWDFQIVPACVTIKAGDSVTWNGNFVTHPLAAFNGASPSPIPNVSSGATTTVKFPSAGVYGYHCTIHGSMIGAVKVTP